MSFESFYGGRQGASFVIVKRFDGIDIPQVPGSEVYKAKYLAVTADKQYFIYDNGFIEKDNENYANYNWKLQALNGSTVNVELPNGSHSTQILDSVLAEGMRQCFEKGGETTAIVNYGEYVIIDTFSKSDPDNGKVYRRGMNFDYNAETNPLAGAEYIGQIVGPQGETPEVSIDHYKYLMETYPGTAFPGEYTVTDEDIVPGSFIDSNGIRQYERTIKYTYVNLKDEYGNVEGCAIGFRLPTVIQDYEARSISPYENRAVDPRTGKYYNYDLIEEDSNYYVNDKWIYPFYQKWQIKVPQGVHGADANNLEIIHSMTMPKGFKSNDSAGTAVWMDENCTIPYMLVGSQVVLENATPLLRDEFYDASETVISAQIFLDNQYLYVKKEDCYMDIVRYKETIFDNFEEGEVRYIEIGYFNDIKRVSLAADGTLIAFYRSELEPKELEEVIRWIDTTVPTGNPSKLDWYEYDGSVYTKSLDTVIMGSKNYYTLTAESDIQPRSNPAAEGFYEFVNNNYVATVDTEVDRSKVYYQIAGTQVGDPQAAAAKGITIDRDGTVTVYYNTLHDDGTGNMVHDTSTFENVLDWVTQVTLAPSGDFDIIFNNDTIQNGHYHTVLKWIDYIQIEADGTIEFYYNSDHENPAYVNIDRIKFIKNIENQTDAEDPYYPGVTKKYESFGDQKLRVTYNTVDGTTGENDVEVLERPINYVIEYAVAKSSLNYPDVPNYHLLVYYSDPEVRKLLREPVYDAEGQIIGYNKPWYTYPSSKVVDGYDVSSNPIYHVWHEWIDLGNVRGEPGGIHNIMDVASLDELHVGGTSSGAWIPPEELTGSGGTPIVGDEGKGWSVTLTPTGSTTTEILFYDYDKEEWYSIGSIDSSLVDPTTIVVKSEPDANQLPDPNDVSNLNENGFWFASETAYYAH